MENEKFINNLRPLVNAVGRKVSMLRWLLIALWGYIFSVCAFVAGMLGWEVYEQITGNRHLSCTLPDICTTSVIWFLAVLVCLLLPFVLLPLLARCLVWGDRALGMTYHLLKKLHVNFDTFVLVSDLTKGSRWFINDPYAHLLCTRMESMRIPDDIYQPSNYAVDLSKWMRDKGLESEWQKIC